uniref:Cullin-3 n=1 Tax=Cajanus cajan TaxID=3821 RepID=A0A151RS89_CAJCA|nr:Cullin-3 [Cajanus cajan]
MSNQKKRNFQIEAFKHRVVMDPKYADKTWKILEHAIHEIYNHNASGLSFEELYRFPSFLFLYFSRDYDESTAFLCCLERKKLFLFCYALLIDVWFYLDLNKDGSLCGD